MKAIHVVIISYNWPPRNAIGTHRPYSWAKYWSEKGVKVTVLTSRKKVFDEPLDLNLPDLPAVSVIEVSYGNSLGSFNSKRVLWQKGGAWLKRIKSLLSSKLGINLDVRDGWYQAALPIAEEIAIKADVIVSTHGPRSSHLIGAAMKRAAPSIKWVADYRDLWSLNHLSQYSMLGRKREKALELESVGRYADAVTSVSQELCDSLQTFLEKPAALILNGFDIPEEELELNLKDRSPVSGQIKIVYTGLIYPYRRDPKPLFEAIRILEKSAGLRPSNLVVSFYGPPSDYLSDLIKECGVSAFVKMHGQVARQVALEAQKNASFVLLLESGEPDAAGVLTGKVFEYIASGTPIISLGSRKDSAIAKLMADSGCGICLQDDVQSITNILLSAIRQEKISWYGPSPDRLKEYSREFQAKKMFDFMLV